MSEHHQDFIVSREDWSLHRKGSQDQKRHMEKVKEAIRENLPELISEDSIILSKGQEVIKIPIRSLDEYKIRYNMDKSKRVGQGDGSSEVGDVLGSAEPGEGGGAGGKQAGDQAGHDVYETEVSIGDIEAELFRDLELPNLEEKDQTETVMDKITFTDVRKKGLIGNIDKKRTILSAIKRNALKGHPHITPFHQDDLRFKTWDIVEKEESRAVVLMMMDTSASMGAFEKYAARSFFFWMKRFLQSKYEALSFEFIAHHTEAKVVDEESFFSKGESGGTICSSAYTLALELIHTKYPPNAYNIYPFHFSDGENMTSDNKKCMELVEQLMAVSSLFGYGEVNAQSRFSTLMADYKKIDHPKFRYYILKEHQDVYEALKTFFSTERRDLRG